MKKGKIITEDIEIKQILADSKTIAILGLSPKPERDSHMVAQYLKEQGYKIIPVRPKQKEILGEKFVTGVKIYNNGKEQELNVAGVIIEIGRNPNTEPFKGLVEFDNDGHIIVDCQGHTSVPGIFASGDVATGHEYQYVISAGQGCMALIKAAKYISTSKEEDCSNCDG